MAHFVQQCGLFSLIHIMFPRPKITCSLWAEAYEKCAGTPVIFTAMIVMMYFQGGPKSVFQLL